MKSIRGGMGLGDAMYVQAVARHLVRRGERLEICSKWPDVFRPLGDKVRFSPFRRANVNILAHYSMRKGRTDTNQFQDVCLQAGIKEPVEFKLDWEVSDSALVAEVRALARGLPIVLVQMPRPPMDRLDGFGKELLPDCAVIQRFIDALQGRALLVQVGAGKSLHEFRGIDLDYSNRTTVSQLLDLGLIADRMLGYVSFMVPLAEQFEKPAMFVWSNRGLKAASAYVRHIKPEKILHRSSSQYVIDDWAPERIDGAINDFLR